MRQSFARLALGAALAFGLAGAGPADAGIVNVTFALTGGLSTTIGPLGPAGSGTMNITFTTPSFSHTTIITGPIHVNSFSFSQVINPPALGGGLQGFVNLTGASLGGFLSLGYLSILGGPLHVAAGQIHCLLGTANCAGIGLPFSVPVNLTSGLVGPLNLLASGVVGGTAPVVFNAAGPAGAFLGFPISLALSGVEISRQHVAEPGALPLLGGLLAGVALVGVRRLRR
jgi:hypothetical protein